jgi:putative restriction endonuclease
MIGSRCCAGSRACAANFRALQPGELFLFKLHAPRSVIVGGGIFAYSNALPWSLAWAAFGEANGARSSEEMRARIARYRRTDPNDRNDFEIGCRILTQPFFFEERDWIPVPPSWSPNIVSFKTYNDGDAEGLSLWEAVNDRVNGPQFSGAAEDGARFGEPHLIRPRLGQGAFRVLVTDIYRRRCAVTQERTLPALEAAHIRPYGDGGEREARNGLLLRRDIHSLFDAGYVTVTPDLNFEVSRRIREEFGCQAAHDQARSRAASIFFPWKKANRQRLRMGVFGIGVAPEDEVCSMASGIVNSLTYSIVASIISGMGLQ